MSGARRTGIPAKAIYGITFVAAIPFAINAQAQSAEKVDGRSGAKEKLMGLGI